MIHLAAIVEGATNSLLNSKLLNNASYEAAKRKNDFEIVRLFEYELDLLRKATWNSLSDEYSKTILGYKLKDTYQEHWQAIKYLFEFRNILAHGGLIVKQVDKISDAMLVREIENEKTIESLTKKELFEFLSSKELIQELGSFEFLRWQFINTKTLDYFELHAKNFLLALYRRYSEENRVDIFTETDISIISEI